MKKNYLKIVLAVAVLSVLVYACTTTKTQKNMSTRQNVLKSFYPVLTSVTRFFGVNSKVVLPKTVSDPVTSVYAIPFELINGDTADLSAYKGKKIVVVTHNGIIKTAVAAIIGARPESIFQIDISPCSITTISVWPSDNLMALRGCNERGHLRG